MKSQIQQGCQLETNNEETYDVDRYSRGTGRGRLRLYAGAKGQQRCPHRRGNRCGNRRRRRRTAWRCDRRQLTRRRRWRCHRRQYGPAATSASARRSASPAASRRLPAAATPLRAIWKRRLWAPCLRVLLLLLNRDSPLTNDLAPSPNHGDRRGKSVDCIILHYTGMSTGAAALARLCDPNSTSPAITSSGKAAGLPRWSWSLDAPGMPATPSGRRDGHEFRVDRDRESSIRAMMAAARPTPPRKSRPLPIFAKTF